jgi:N-methylhydantoinase A
MKLDRVAAERTIRTCVAEPLGLEVAEAARAIIRVANANMADAVRLISIRRGYDPREFVLVVFGGAGTLHGAALARELSIPTVLVPPSPGITSAFGCLLVDVRHDLSTMFLAPAERVKGADVEEEFRTLEAEARERLRHEGVPEDQIKLQRSVDMRYLGQWRALSVPVGSPLTSLDRAVETFHAEHEREHNYRRDEAPVEIYRLNVWAVGVTPKPEFTGYELNGSRPQPVTTRQVLFDEQDQWLETPIFQRHSLDAGTTLAGPAIVEQLDTTVLIPPGIGAQVDEWLNIRMQIPGTTS